MKGTNSKAIITIWILFKKMLLLM